MIYMDDINKFYTIISDLKASGVPVHLYGSSNEIASGAHFIGDNPPNDALRTRIVALTSVGTIYCNSFIKLEKAEAIENAKQLYNELAVSDADVTYSKETGTVTIKQPAAAQLRLCRQQF